MATETIVLEVKSNIKQVSKETKDLTNDFGYLMSKQFAKINTIK